MTEPVPAAKPVKESQAEYSELALPNDVNPLGNLLGGKVMPYWSIWPARSPLHGMRASPS